MLCFAEESVVRKRSSRREPSVSLHTDKLETLLNDAMKHKDSWPFIEPVSTDDVSYIQNVSFNYLVHKLKKNGFAEICAFIFIHYFKTVTNVSLRIPAKPFTWFIGVLLHM